MRVPGEKGRARDTGARDTGAQDTGARDGALTAATRITGTSISIVQPAEPILAVVGEDTELGCHLSPEKSAEDMGVCWFRSRFWPALRLYQGQRERTEEQMRPYRGRTTFVSGDIRKGRVALVIHNVTARDHGTYRCYFQQGRSYDEAVVGLVVAGVGSKPLIEMKGQEDWSVWLECTSTGWYPEPRAVWTDPYGELMPTLEEAYTEDTHGLIKSLNKHAAHRSGGELRLGPWIPGNSKEPDLGRKVTPSPPRGWLGGTRLSPPPDHGQGEFSCSPGALRRRARLPLDLPSGPTAGLSAAPCRRPRARPIQQQQ
ncbi:butyrophilin subfamily 2 member A2-like [Phyllostomus discolor]|uniref:Butyrophilin subfamily 2 member A2-like n=1 Tax=Phyllostomus discolor TaxID=89673 RepID=A0A7E6CVM5_9CHIR|nr:butyrophilin subfamily 2 member A2-like [Phyllostomus discolor]